MSGYYGMPVHEYDLGQIAMKWEPDEEPPCYAETADLLRDWCAMHAAVLVPATIELGYRDVFVCDCEPRWVHWYGLCKTSRWVKEWHVVASAYQDVPATDRERLQAYAETTTRPLHHYLLPVLPAASWLVG